MTLKVHDEDGRQSKIGFGFVKVLSNVSVTGASTSKVTEIGIWRDSQNTGLGFRQSNLIFVPLDCHVSFVISSAEEGERAAKIVENLISKFGEKICLIDPA